MSCSSLYCADLAHRAGDVVGVDLEAADEATGMVLDRAVRRLGSRADHPDVDAPLVHLGDRHLDAVVALVEPVRDVLEHVAGGELPGGLVLAVRRLPEVVVGLRRIGLREADHQVDRADVGGHGHAVLLSPLVERVGSRNWMRAEVVDESLQQVAERALVGGRPAVEHVAQVGFEDVGDPVARLTPGGRDLDHDHACVVGVRGPLHEAELLQLAHLPTGRRRVHAGGPGELAERRRPVLVDPTQQRVGGAGEVDTGRGREPGVPVAARPQAVELLERPLGAGHVVHGTGPYRTCLSPASSSLRGGRSAGRRGPRRGSRGARRTRGRGPRGRTRR